jgi:hypothetical protein
LETAVVVVVLVSVLSNCRVEVVELRGSAAGSPFLLTTAVFGFR